MRAFLVLLLIVAVLLGALAYRYLPDPPPMPMPPCVATQRQHPSADVTPEAQCQH
jgi:hypothetical protein